MRRRKRKTLRWLTLAALLPLLVLGFVAWLGIQTQMRLVWSSARDDAERLAPVLAKTVAEDLEKSMRRIPLYPDPPVPGGITDADAVLMGTEIASLVELRDSAEAGNSPAGLPRRALAALRIHQLEPNRQTADLLARILTRDAPSILTGRALDGISASPAVRSGWQRDEAARAIWRASEALEQAWLPIPGSEELILMRAAGDDLEFVTVNPSTAVASSVVPTWAHAYFYHGTANRRMLASTAVPVGSGLMLGILPDARVLEAGARQQARWTLALLACAVLVSAASLFMIQRTFERERRLNSMKSDFVASVSHELRAPVASIRLMADALVAGKIEQKTVGEFHGLISREGARLSTLIENVLDFARIEQGRKRWFFEQTALAPLVRETLAVMGPLADEKGIFVALAEPLPGVVAQVDPVAIQQALVNLLDNAIKFSPADSRVEVRLSETADATGWEISVTDHGPGIPIAEQRRVFEKFYRLGGELRRETQGTGIGLSLVKAIARAHGGSVRLESIPGKGCTFTLGAPFSPSHSLSS